MGLWELIALAVGVSMDAFAVSVCKGLAMPKARLHHGIICGAWFGGFQALMPLIGFFLGGLFAGVIQAFDHWVAFALLAIIGINMLRECLGSSDCCECENHNADLSFRTMLLMAIATSIDALAVGISLAMEPGTNIFLAVTLIGLTTFTFCTLGVKLGNLFGCKFEKPSQIAGGVILILLGVKILLEDLGILVL